jgi:hypothetical protein
MPIGVPVNDASSWRAGGQWRARVRLAGAGGVVERAGAVNAAAWPEGRVIRRMGCHLYTYKKGGKENCVALRLLFPKMAVAAPSDARYRTSMAIY